MNNKFVALSVYQKNVVDRLEIKELELVEELSDEEEMMKVVGGVSAFQGEWYVKGTVVDTISLLSYLSLSVAI